MTRVAWWVVVGLLVPVAAAAEGPGELPTDLIVERSIAEGGVTLRVRLVRPSAEDRRDHATDLLPLVVVPAPPGAGVSGAKGWATFSTSVLVSVDARLRYPAFVAELSLVGVEDRALRGGAEPSGDERRVAALAAAVDALVGEYAVDPHRVFLVGEGEGADLAWRLLAGTPERYAARVFIGGLLDPQLVGRVYGTPLWVFCDAADERAPIERTRAVVSAIWAGGGTRARYTETRDSGPVWNAAWREDRLLPWLFSQSRE
ncbi:MAG: hypothetical protein ACOC2D_03235 [Spirochaetota bacterium]